MKLSKKTKEKLLSLYKSEGEERGGYILGDEVIECPNVHINKLENFQFDFDSIDKLDENEDNIVALFHTHPNGTNSISKQDFYAFINWPQFLHVIVGKNGISCYKATEKETVIVEEIEYED